MPPADCSRPAATRPRTTIRTARHAATGQTLPDAALGLNHSFPWTVRVSYCKFGAMTAPRTPTTAEELRGAGLRVTAARVALLETVRDGDHLGVEAITSGVRNRIGHVSLQAVYDALHALTAAGLLRRIEPAGSPARFEGRVGDNHHHVVCRSCGVVADVDCAVSEAPCLTASDDHGFSIGEAEVTYWGLCPGCSTARSS
jgi:Fur family transcriptional regulator, stress-responsive regulator